MTTPGFTAERSLYASSQRAESAPDGHVRERQLVLAAEGVITNPQDRCGSFFVADGIGFGPTPQEAEHNAWIAASANACNGCAAINCACWPMRYPPLGIELPCGIPTVVNGVEGYICTRKAGHYCVGVDSEPPELEPGGDIALPEFDIEYYRKHRYYWIDLPDAKNILAVPAVAYPVVVVTGAAAIAAGGAAATTGGAVVATETAAPIIVFPVSKAAAAAASVIGGVGLSSGGGSPRGSGGGGGAGSGGGTGAGGPGASGSPCCPPWQMASQCAPCWSPWMMQQCAPSSCCPPMGWCR
jgi:hypothetical protein